MNHHLTSALVALVVGSASAFGIVKYVEPPHVVQVINSPAPVTSQAKAERAARTVWPALPQSEVDALTLALKRTAPTFTVTIFCIEDAKCEDLALSLENAFESAHWQVEVRNSPMVPAGILTSSTVLLDALRAKTSLPVGIDSFSKNVGPGEYIVIGARS